MEATASTGQTKVSLKEPNFPLLKTVVCPVEAVAPPASIKFTPKQHTQQSETTQTQQYQPTFFYRRAPHEFLFLLDSFGVRKHSQKNQLPAGRQGFGKLSQSRDPGGRRLGSTNICHGIMTTVGPLWGSEVQLGLRSSRQTSGEHRNLSQTWCAHDSNSYCSPSLEPGLRSWRETSQKH